MEKMTIVLVRMLFIAQYGMIHRALEIYETSGNVDELVKSMGFVQECCKDAAEVLVDD